MSRDNTDLGLEILALRDEIEQYKSELKESERDQQELVYDLRDRRIEMDSLRESNSEYQRLYNEMAEEYKKLKRERNYMKQYLVRLDKGIPSPDLPGSILKAVREKP